MQGKQASGGARAWVSISPQGGTTYAPQLAVQRERIQGAMGASFVSHAMAVVLAVALVRAPPVSEPPPAPQSCTRTTVTSTGTTKVWSAPVNANTWAPFGGTRCELLPARTYLAPY